MQRFDLVEKLKEAQDRLSSLEGDLRTFLENYLKTHRKYPNGQKVEVFDEMDKSVGIGFIQSAQCAVSTRWGFRPKDYLGKETAWIEDLNDIMYHVVKMKKDGTPSSHSLLWEKPREVKKRGRHYLKPVE